jgi:hypothetical protein
VSSPRIALLLVLFCAACATTPPAPAGDARPALEGAAPRDLALEALSLDGLDGRMTTLSTLGEVVSRSLREAALREAEGGALTLASRQRLTEVRRAAFAVYKEGVLRIALVDGVLAHPGSEHLPEVVTFLRSPRARLAADKRARVFTSSGQKALALYLGERATKPPDEVRLRLVRGLLDASRESELMEALSYDASATFLSALEGELEGELEGAFRQWRAEETGRSTFARQIQKSLVLQSYFALIELSTAELAELAAFWQSPAGRWWADARIEAARAALKERAGAFEEELRARPREPAPAPA